MYDYILIKVWGVLKNFGYFDIFWYWLIKVYFFGRYFVLILYYDCVLKYIICNIGNGN